MFLPPSLAEQVPPDVLHQALLDVALRRKLKLAPPDERTLLEREASRRGLSAYRTFEEFVRGRQPDLLEHAYMRKQVSVAQRVIDGELNRVLVLMPTQYGKSSIWSRLLPAFYLHKFPARVVALASYGADLAWEHSGEARDLYSAAGGLFKDGNAKGSTRNWRTKRTTSRASGGMWATGIGGPSLGRGYNLGIVDDPIDPLQVGSPAFQRRFAGWWPSKWLRGQRPGSSTAIIFVMQRLAVDDPVEWLLQREEDGRSAEHWHILVMDEIRSSEPFGRYSGPQGFPATCTVEPDARPVGALLAPKFRTRAEVVRLQATAGAIIAGAQRQQRPMRATGDFWPLRSFEGRFFDTLPSDALDLGWDWDTAYSKEEHNSASAGIQTARSAGPRDHCKVYVNDVDWDWLEFPQLIERMKAKIGPHYVEKKASGKSAVQTLKVHGVPAYEVPVLGDKLARATAAQPVVTGGRVYVNRLVWHKLLYGEHQGLLRVTAESLQGDGEGLDLNDAFVQAVWRHLDIAAKRKKVKFM